MTKEELETRLNAAEKEIADLKAKLNEASEIPEFLEFNIGDVVWYMDDNLNLYNYINSVSKTRKSYNNFHTPEYAKTFADKCREIAMLLHCKWHIDRDYVPDWDDGNDDKFSVMWHHDPNDKGKEEYVVVNNLYYSENPIVYFSSREAAQKAADWMNERHKQERSD